MEPEFFQQLEAVNNPAAAAASSYLGTTELHGEHSVSLEAHVANCNLFTGGLLLRGGFDNRGAALAAKQERRRITFRIAADKKNLLTLLRHHV